MKIRFFYKGETREVDPDELLPKLHRAPNEYAVTTGRIATHLVLGENEWLQFQGYVAYLKSIGHIRDDGSGSTFCGLIVLRSANQSLLMAVEQIQEAGPAVAT